MIKNKIYSDFVIFDKEVKYFNKKIVEFINNKDTLDKSYLKKIENSGKNFKQITYSNPKIALVGKRPDGFDTCDYKESELKNKLHTNVSKISLKKLFKISSKIEKNEIINTKKKLKVIARSHWRQFGVKLSPHSDLLRPFFSSLARGRTRFSVVLRPHSPFETSYKMT